MKFAEGLAIDTVAVLVFAIVGRTSHAESPSLTGVLSTAWPFLAGLAAGHLVDAVRRRAAGGAMHRGGPASAATGILAWVGAAAVGILLRQVVGGDAAPVAFVLVTTLSLAILLLGWRVGLLLIRRARQTQSRRISAP